MDKREFEALAKVLPIFDGLDMSAKIIAVEPISGDYFKDNSRQRCVIERSDGKRYVANYD